MRKIYVIILLFVTVFYGCNTPNAAVFNEAQWITDTRPLPDADSLFYEDSPAPLFRKEFTIGNDVESARLIITSAGYYISYMNGERVGDIVLDPAWTDYSKRIYFTEYDVTNMLKDDQNCLAVTLGNSFYNPLPLRMWGRVNLRERLSVGKPSFIAELVIQYANGKTEKIRTDDSWKFSYGALLKDNVYLGVKYDAGKEKKGWKLAGYDDQDWNKVVTTNGPGGKLQPAVAEPVKVVSEIKPVKIYEYKDDVYIVDMGVNFTGTYRISLPGNPGDTVRIRFGERTYESGALNPMTTVCGQIKREGVGGPGAPDIAWQEDVIILDSDDIEFSPEFTYHVYRFMEISGLSEQPELSDITGLFYSTELNHNHFESSSELLNKIQDATVRTFLANLISVQSDCPAREKFGYGGDLNATSESFIYNFDMKDFYRKTIYDWLDAMKDSLFVDTAPSVGIQYCGISWESAFLITQYQLYQYYGDTALVRELYEKDLEWMGKVELLHPEGLVKSGLSDHESMEAVPVQLTGTAHYLQCAKIMKEFSSLMDDDENYSKFERLENKLLKIMKDNFIEKQEYEVKNKQTLYATLIYHDIVAPDKIDETGDILYREIQKDINQHFITGIFGTKYVLEALSRAGKTAEVFDIVNSTEFPGWGYMIDNGATTIWETWEESENTFSNCHPMFGSVTEWFYRYLGGIRPIPESPGFEKFILGPDFSVDLEFVNCSYQSPFGMIKSNWKKKANGTVGYDVSIPEGTSAKVYIPAKGDKVNIKSISPADKDLSQLATNGGFFELEAGDYVIDFEIK